MPTFSYKGYEFEVDHTPSAEEFQQMSAHVDTLPPKEAKHKTSIGEDIQTGLEDIGHDVMTANQMVSGGITGALGFTDARDRIFDQMTERRKAREEYKKTLDQGLGGQIVSGISGIAPMIAAAPVAGPVAAAGAFAGVGALSSGATNVEHGMDSGKAISQAMLEGATDTAAMALPIGMGVLKGAAYGAGGNVGSQVIKDVSGQAIAETPEQASPYQFDADKYIVAGATGAVPGAVFGKMNHNGALDAPVESAGVPTKLPTEQGIMEKVQKQIDAEIEHSQKAILDINSRGSFKPEEVAEITYRSERIDTLLQRKAEVVAGTDDPMVVAKVKEQLAAELQQQRDAAVPQVEEPSLKQQPIEKTTPTEVALTKINEAKQMSPDDLFDHITKTENKLQETPEGKTALRESLQNEIDAYIAISEGKEPDLTKFGAVVEPTTVQELITSVEQNPAHILDAAESNPHLFNKKEGTGSYFDKAIQDLPYGKTVEKILNHFLDITGLSKDNIYFMHDPNLTSLGKTEYAGNTGLIRLNLNKLEAWSNTPNIWKSVITSHLVGENVKGALNAFMAVRVGAHEIGHVLLNRYLRGFVENKTMYDGLVKKFNDFKQDYRSVNASPFDMKTQSSAARYRDRQASFHEFFAEEVTKKLLYKHTLGAFSGDKSGIFHGLVDMSIKVLEEHGMRVDRKTFAQDMIDDILTQNEETLKQYEKTIWEKLEGDQNNKDVDGLPTQRMFSHLSLEEVMYYTQRELMTDVDPFVGLALEDAGTILTKAANSLGSGIKFISRKTLGKERMAEISNTEVYDAMRTIRDSEETAASIVNKLWNGVIDTKNMDGFLTLFKQKNPDSPFAVMSKITDKELFTLAELYKKGFEEGLPYAENLAKNGSELSPLMKTNYEIMSKLFAEMGKVSTDVQQGLGKKSIMNIRDGWFPSVRQGRFSVTVGFGDIVAHREHFNTKLQAEKFKAKLEESGLGRANISDVLDGKTEGHQTNAMMAEILFNTLARNGLPQSKEIIQRVVDSMNERGGKMGMHHEFRQGVTGFKGDEFFKTPEQLGKSFREAIEQAVTEKGNQVKTMLINDKIRPTLDNMDYKMNNPESWAVIDQMYRSSLGRNSEVTNFSDFVHDSMNKITDDVFKIFGSELTGDKNAVTSSLEAAKTLFYFTKMIPSVAFSIVGQYMNVLPGTVSRASYDGHGLMAYKSFAKGMTKLAVGNKELWTAIKEDSQKYNVFTASFIESMDMHKAESPLMGVIKDWVLLQKPAQVADSFSRVMSYAVLYTHYRDLGKNDQAARREARFESDAIMNIYDKANSAPIFEHMGVIGDMIKPLQGFGQNMLGNVFRAVQHMDAKDYKTWGPMINYTVLTIAMGGVMALPFIQEYEMLRKWLGERFEDFTLPSILDIVGSDDGIVNRVVPLDKQQRQQLYLGVLATGSEDDELGGGIDWAKSGRTNATLYTILAGAVGGIIASEATTTKPMTTMPILDWATSVPADLFEIGKYLGGGSSVATAKKAVENVAPSGHLGYGIKELMGLNTTKIGGENTDMMAVGKEGGADMPRTKADIWAGLAGTKSTEQKWSDQITMENSLKEKQIQTKKDKAAIKFVETGDEKYIKKMQELGMNDKAIQQKIETEVWNRSVGQETRQMVNKQGKMTEGKGVRSAQRIFGFGSNE